MNEEFDPNCPKCGAHDFMLHAMVNGGECIHCNRKEAERYRWIAAHVAGDAEENIFIFDVALPIDPFNPFETDEQIAEAFALAVDTKIIEDKTP